LLQAERDIGLALSSTSDLKFALDRLLDIAMQLEGIDCGGIYLMDANTGDLHLEAQRGLSESFLKRISHYRADATETQVARAGRMLYVRHEEIPRSLQVLWGSEGLHALAVAPIQHKGGVVGMLNLGSYRLDEIPARTRVGIEMIAAQVAGAIARIRAEETSRRSEAHLRRIVNSAPIALTAVDPQGIITFEDGQALAGMGVKPGARTRQSVFELYRDFPLMLENANRALAGEEFTSTVEFDSTVFECHYAPALDPKREPAGFIAVATDVTERFRLQRQLLEISDREQARIGQDIHDGLCQQLISLAFNANSLEQKLRTHAQAESSAIQKICGRLDEAITESRRVCRGLYPLRLQTEGLMPALEELAHTVSDRHAVRCTAESDEKLPPCHLATATHLYRIAQEAVNNAIKHSECHSILIRLGRTERGLQLVITDDGKGMQAEPGRSSGMGLHIMDYRARTIGGMVTIREGQPGTVVVCQVPLRIGWENEKD
jgi:PAS domain S-box-containing protein